MRIARVYLTAIAFLAFLFVISQNAVQAQCLFTNNNFESGTLTGWTIYNRSNDVGNWYNYTGTITPLSLHSISAPPQGTRAVTTDHTAATTHALSQDFTFPAGQSGTLSFFLAYNNTHSSFITLNSLDFVSNQQVRVDLMKTTAGNESVAPGDVYGSFSKPGRVILLS